jgi:hypothetical protein
MERGNSKHGPRLDEEMRRETLGVTQGTTDPRVEEWHQTEPSGEDQPNTSQTPAGYERAGTPPGMTREEVDERSNLGRYIPMSVLPGDRAEIIEGARRMDAPDAVIAELERLPDDKFETVNQIWAALGHHNEAHRT